MITEIKGSDRTLEANKMNKRGGRAIAVKETMKKEQARKLVNACRIAVDLMALGCFCGVAVMMLVNNGAPLFWALAALIVPAAVIGLIGVVFGSTFKN